MKSHLLIILLLFSVSCGNNSPQVAQNANSNSNAQQPMRAEKLESTTAHTTENQTPKPANANSANGGKWSQSGEPIDTAKFDGTIAEAEKTFKAKATDEAAKKTLAEAYFDRGFALTEARQYAAALGDYRRALKYDPNHEEAKKWMEQIINIYAMLKKDYPKEGEEPPALPFKK
jgi:tetratricopeptide (TPR) repeat protein